MSRNVLIVIPVHNALDHTLSCLRSLEHEADLTVDLLIIDNGSSPETTTGIKQVFPQLQIISQGNLGYGAAANLGIAESHKRNYNYTWVLNSDIVVSPGTIGKLAAFMDAPENSRVGACSPVIYRADEPDTVDFAGGWLNRSSWAVNHIGDPRVGEQALKASPLATFLTGCALFVRNDAALDIGMFDEQFFMYWEDCDFSVRLVDGGWSLRLAPSASVVHGIQGSTGGNGDRSVFSSYYESRNCFLLWRKHTGGYVRKFVTCLRMLQWIVRTFISRQINPMTDQKRAVVEGIVDGLLGRYGEKCASLSNAQAQVVALFVWSLVLPLRAVSAISKMKTAPPSRVLVHRS
jgi:GT2 family glycosyltransferase